MVEEILGEIKNLALHVLDGDRYIYNMYFTQNRLLTFYLDTGHIGPAYPVVDLGSFRFKLKNKHKINFVGKKPTFGIWKNQIEKMHIIFLKNLFLQKLLKRNYF